ncbi:MAG: peptidoglycan binding domain-containing protein, partial [Gammaproteobacteria bacterium]
MAALLLFVAVVLVIDAAREEVVADGVRIGSVDVGGLDRQEARQRVQRELGGEVPNEVTAAYKDERFVLRPEQVEAGLDADASVDAALSHSRRGTNPFSRVLTSAEASGTVTPRISVARAALTRFVGRVAAQVERSARDADIDWRDGKLERTPARNGVVTRRSALMEAVLEQMR